LQLRPKSAIYGARLAPGRVDPVAALSSGNRQRSSKPKQHRIRRPLHDVGVFVVQVEQIRSIDTDFGLRPTRFAVG
jgi:hypothetical protein